MKSRILVVEDSETIHMSFKVLVPADRYELVFAVTSQGALRLWRGAPESFLCIISDTDLGAESELDGVELLQLIWDDSRKTPPHLVQISADPYVKRSLHAYFFEKMSFVTPGKLVPFLDALAR